MKRICLGILLFSGAAALALSSAAPAPIALGPGGVIEHHEKLFEKLDAWTFDELGSFFAGDGRSRDQALVFLTDGFGGRHESWHGVDATDLVKRWALTTGNKTRITKQQVDCPSGDVSYAVFEFERDCPMTSGDTVLHTFRSTSLLRHTEDGFKIFHWHISKAGADQSGEWDIGVVGPEDAARLDEAEARDSEK